MTDYRIRYVKGDATEPIGVSEVQFSPRELLESGIHAIGGLKVPQVLAYSEGQHFIIHCCNNIGKWGAGFVLALSKKWSEPKHAFKANPNPRLGTYQIVRVSDNLSVVNLYGRDGIRTSKNKTPVRYDALRVGLHKFKHEVSNAIVHMPRIGCGLAGGDWNIVEEIIKEELSSAGILVTVYDL